MEEVQNNNDSKKMWFEDKELVKRLSRIFQEQECSIAEAVAQVGITVDQFAYYKRAINPHFCIATDWRWWLNPEGEQSEKLIKLEDAFIDGCTDMEACIRAGISRDQLYYYQKKFPEFLPRKELLKSDKNVLVRDILLRRVRDLTEEQKAKMTPEEIKEHEEKQYSAARHYAERKLPDYKQKLDVSTLGDKIPNAFTIDIVTTSAEDYYAESEDEGDDSIEEEPREQEENKD